MKAKGKPRSRRTQVQKSAPRWGIVAIVVGLTLAGLAGLWYLTRSSEPATASNPGSNGPTAEGPRLALNEDYFDFGNMKLEQWARREFRLRNVGNQPLMLQGIPTVEVVEGC